MDEGKTIAEVARDVDLTTSALASWVKQARADRDGGKSGLTSDERPELATLRELNRELKRMSALAVVGLDDAGNDVALDELSLLLGGLAERSCGKAVDVSHGAEGGLVKQDDRVGGKQLSVAAGAP